MKKQDKIVSMKEQKIKRYVDGTLKEYHYGVPNKHKEILSFEETQEVLDKVIEEQERRGKDE